MAFRGAIFPSKYFIFFVSVIVTVVWTRPGCAFPFEDSDQNEGVFRSETSEGEQLTSVTIPIELLSVERSPVSAGNRFTIRVKNNVEASQPYIRIHLQNSIQTAPDDIVEENGAVWAATIVVRNDSQLQDYPWIIIVDLAYRHQVAFQLDNTGSDPASQDFLKMPVVDISPAIEAVYEPGQDVNVSVVLRGIMTDEHSSPSNRYRPNLVPTFIGVDLDTGMYMDAPDSTLFTFGEPLTVGDNTEAWLTVKTSTHHVSGMLQLNTDVENTGSLLVGHLQISRIITVRPSNQTGAFPEGFFTIMNHFWKPTSKNGNELDHCTVGTECSLSCHAIGESVSDIDAFKVKPDGSLEPIPSDVKNRVAVDHFGTVLWLFQAEENSGDRDGITTFQCQAHSGTTNQTVAKLVDVQAVIPGNIDHGRSSMTVEGDVNDYYKTVTLTCGINGRPLPDVYFSGGTYFNLYGASADNVTVTGQNEGVAILVTSIGTPDLQRLINGIRAGTATGPACEMFSSVEGGRIIHRFQIPEINWTNVL